MSLKRFWPIVIFLLCAGEVYAQMYNFKHFSSDQGVSENRINALCEDKRGNLWIGTGGDGLLKYDGYAFVSYRNDEGLVSPTIYAISEDRSGRLWIGTEEGICTYDGVRFHPFEQLEKQKVTSIVQDASGNHWFATSTDGLYKYDGKSLIPFSTTQKDLPGKNITSLFLDSKNNLWIGTPKGIAKYNKNEFRFYTKTDGLPGNNVRAIAEDRHGSLWLATDAGLSKFDGAHFTNVTSHGSFRLHEIHAITADRKDNVWLATSGGISKYDGKDFRHHNPHIGQNTTGFVSAYKDESGNLWFGSSDRGLSKLDSERFIHYPENDQMGKRVYSIIQAINGNIICGTSMGGTTVFDGRHYTLLDKREGFTSSVVQCFFYSQDSTLWVGTQDEGVYQFSKTKLYRHTVEEGFVSNNIIGFAEGKDGYLWIASADSGVSLVNPVNDSLRVVNRFNATNGLSGNRLTSITCDGDGVVWVGTEDKGLNRIVTQPGGSGYTITQFTVAQGLNSNTVHCIRVDSLRHVYIGTSKGLNIHDGHRLIKISKADGLSSNNIYSLTFDRDHNLWAGTERGVDMISIGNNFNSISIQHYDSEEGFKGVEVYRNSSCIDRDGNLWFGTVNGLVKYNPQEEVATKLTPRVHLTGIKLFFDNIEDTKYADSISAWYAIPRQLTLPHHQNNLTFSFVGIHLRAAHSVRYKWMLEGFSKDWSPPLTQREATFSNLPPGDYTFKVIACNEYNIWSEAPASFSFTILTPFWQRWWVRASGIALIVLLSWMIFYVRLQGVKAKNKIIQERLEMEKNILELEQEAARLQMNPHFIFNALNSIQGFISTNDAVQAKKYLAKFARLMRLILENAREEFIPLQNEISILENYLELEKLSCNHTFDFEITTDEAIDRESVHIPPMLLQPFVENAIVHGIKRKTGRGLISIRFKINDGIITCEIEDNGIGRKKSNQINGQTRPHHKSTGISVTQKRLEQYGAHRNVKAGVEFIDLEQNGIPSGTKVVISTPYEE